MSKLLSKTRSTSIESAIRDSLKEIGEVDSDKLWRKVFALFKFNRVDDSMSISDTRNSDNWKSFVLEESTNLLQQM